MTNEVAVIDPSTLLEDKITVDEDGEEAIYAEAEEVVREFGGLPITKVHQRSPYINMLAYGESGVGKTQFLGSASELSSLSPVLFLDIEGGTETLRHTYPNVEIVRVTRWKQITDIYAELRRGKHPYKTFGVDSLTELQRFNMDSIMQEVVKKDAERDRDIPSVREWGKSGENVRRFIRIFRDLPMNVFFTALEKTDKNNRGASTFAPDLPGKLSSQVAAFLDIVTYYYTRTVKDGDVKTEKRYMLTKKTETHTAKDRTGKLPRIIENPTIKKLWDSIYADNDTNNSDGANAANADVHNDATDVS